MRRGLLLAIGLVWVAVGLAGCVDLEFGGGEPPASVPAVPVEERVVPTAVFGKEFDKPARLVLPTLTPSPVPEGEWDGFERAGLDGVKGEFADVPDSEPIPVRVYSEEPFDFVGYAAVEGVWSGLEDGGLVTCVDMFRRMLVGYEGRRPFGPEVAEELSGELVRLRPDCGEAGWAPEFRLEAVCVQGRLAGKPLPEAMVVREGSLKIPRALGSRKDVHGNTFVQFERMPFVDSRGCWLFTVYDGAWAWFVSGVGVGVDMPEFHACEDVLRGVLVGEQSAEMGAHEVAQAVEVVKEESGGRCHSAGWDLYPRSEGHVGCGDGALETGWTEDGSLVVNWQVEHRGSTGALCWIYDGETGEWREYLGGGPG